MSHPAVIERRRRIHRIRARVAAGTAALFIALFGGLYVQMAAGRDPALSASSAQVASTTATTDSSGSADSSGSTDSSTTGSSATDSSAMTTQAS
jgi:hypothetical protein